jgi:osmoprotectant transport system substrate-binding protein
VRAPRPRSWTALVAVLLVLAAGCTGAGAGPGSIARDFDLDERRVTERGGGGSNTRFVVGSKDFAEQEILGHIAVVALRAGGAEVVDRTGTGGTDEVRRALLSGEIDLYWEYTGTGWLIQLAQTAPQDPQQLYPELARLDRDRNGIAWLEPAPADNTYAIAVRDEAGEQDPDLAAVRTVSDLATLIQQQPSKATLCVGPEFSERADGLPGLAERYGLAFPPRAVSVLPDDTVYGAVDGGQRCAFGSVFATSGLVSALGLRLLDDDRGFFVPYNPAPTMRQETLDDRPALAELFARISPKLDTTTLRGLSAQVVVDRRTPADVAAQWMREQGLV